MKKVTKIKVSLSGNKSHRASLDKNSSTSITASGTKFKLKGQTI